ncbi:Cell wall / vacuolar inhibitor of fructosidase 1 [Linum grandiflorum]
MATSTKLVTQLAVFFIFLFIFLNSAESNTPLIKQTCKRTPDYALCVSLLSTRAAKATSVKSLALAMIDVVKAKATATLKEIEWLFANEPSLKDPLTACANMYRVIVDDDVSVAINAVRLGDPKFGEGAMNDAGNEADSCERGFEQGESPLTELNKAVRKVADVASAIIRVLL